MVVWLVDRIDSSASVRGVVDAMVIVIRGRNPSHLRLEIALAKRHTMVQH